MFKNEHFLTHFLHPNPRQLLNEILLLKIITFWDGNRDDIQEDNDFLMKFSKKQPKWRLRSATYYTFVYVLLPPHVAKVVLFWCTSKVLLKNGEITFKSMDSVQKMCMPHISQVLTLTHSVIWHRQNSMRDNGLWWMMTVKWYFCGNRIKNLTKYWKMRFLCVSDNFTWMRLHLFP